MSVDTTSTPAPGNGNAEGLRSHNDAQRVRRAPAVLDDLNALGVLAAADVHVTQRLVTMCGAPVGDAALAATALAVRAVRLGSTCLALGTVSDVAAAATPGPVRLPSAADIVAELRDCPLVIGAPGAPLRPLVLMESDDGPLLYLQKYFRQEQAIRTALSRRAERAPIVDDDRLDVAIAEVFVGGDVAPRQRVAARLAAIRWTSILAGGPGTGKTYTVARILAVLDLLAGGRTRIGMCAPTGRAAAQLQASVDNDGSLPGTVHAVTVHSLLGWRPGSTPHYGRGNKLPHDVVVVDETSMLSMTAMSRLLDAIRDDARLILVGDPHQLASVEAGAVLADLVERDPAQIPAVGGIEPAIAALAGDAGLTDDERLRLRDGVVTLRHGFRFGSQIARVADAVNAGDADTVLDLVTSPTLHDVKLIAPDSLGAVHDDIVAWGRRLHAAAVDGDVHGALGALDAHRVLCAHRDGSWGVRGWQSRIADWLSALPGHPRILLDAATSIPGQPILVTANDRQTATFNGDCGVVIALPAGSGTAGSASPTAVAFRRGSEERLIAPARLADTMPAYAMTIHRSQGSQFDTVTVVLPPGGSELLTRELLYTAITRARTRVRIVGTPEVLREAVQRRVHRASGLRSVIRPLGTS
ncbi:exodeoxyribonuclease V subunit alpha [Gordonia sp. NPDC003429]